MRYHIDLCYCIYIPLHMRFLSFPGFIPLTKCTIRETEQAKRQSERESEVGRQSAKQPAMRSSIQTARQTTCPVTVHPPGERGQWPTPVSVCLSHRASAEEKQLLSESIWRIVLLTEQQTLQCCDRGPCCLSEDLSFTLTKNIPLAFPELKILRLRNYLVGEPEVFHTC